MRIFERVAEFFEYLSRILLEILIKGLSDFWTCTLDGVWIHSFELIFFFKSLKLRPHLVTYVSSPVSFSSTFHELYFRFQWGVCANYVLSWLQNVMIPMFPHAHESSLNSEAHSSLSSFCGEFSEYSSWTPLESEITSRLQTHYFSRISPIFGIRGALMGTRGFFEADR